MAGLGNDPLNTGILQHVSHLGRLEEIVDGHHHGIGGEGPEQGTHKLRAILEPNGDAITGSNPFPYQEPRRSQDLSPIVPITVAGFPQYNAVLSGEA